MSTNISTIGAGAGNDGEIRASLRNFIAGFIRNKEFHDNDDIFKGGFVNSMFVMQLILFIEKNFALAVENEDLELKNFSSVDVMVSFITRKLAPAAVPCA